DGSQFLHFGGPGCGSRLRKRRKLHDSGVRRPMNVGDAEIDLHARDYGPILPVVSAVAADEPPLRIDAADGRYPVIAEGLHKVIVLPGVAGVGTLVDGGTVL